MTVDRDCADESDAMGASAGNDTFVFRLNLGIVNENNIADI